MTPLPWIYSDGGRAIAGYRGEADDCVTRAIAIATDLPYADVYAALGENQPLSARHGVRRNVYQAFLEAHGFVWHPTMSIGSGCQVHLAAGELPDGIIIARLSKHIVTVLDGVIHDTHDPTREGTRCVYGYFELP